MKALPSIWMAFAVPVFVAGTAAAETYSWQFPNNGDWSVTGNWQGPPPSAPQIGGSSAYTIAFGDDGTPYFATNDLTDITRPAFVLNRLQLTRSSAALSYLYGAPLMFSADDGTPPGLDFNTGGDGGFMISNALVFADDTTLGGGAAGGTVKIIGAITNLGCLSFTGSYAIVLSNANNKFIGPLVVNCTTSGVLQADHLNSFNGPGAITVSNGTLRTTPVPAWDVAWYLAYNQSNRQALVTGSNSVWTNKGSFYVARATSSGFNTLTIEGGGRFFTGNGGFVGYSASFNSLIVSNGGLCVLGGNWGAIGGNEGSNNTILVTGTGSVLKVPVNFLVAGGTGTGNVLRVENGGRYEGYVSLGGNTESILVTGGGQLVGGCGPLAYNVNWGAPVKSRIVISGAGTFAGWRIWTTRDNYYASSSFSDNQLVIDDNAVVSNTLAVPFCVGWSDKGTSTWNSVIVTNGGRFSTAFAVSNTIAYGNLASNNSAVVTGSNSVWDFRGGSLLIGVATGAESRVEQNCLTVRDGGTVTNINALTITDFNAVNMYGGNLTVTTLTNCPNGQIGVDLDGPGRFAVLGDATLGGFVCPTNYSRTAKKFCTVLTCAGTLDGNLSLGPLPSGYSGVIMTNLLSTPKEITLLVSGPATATMFTVR